MEFSGNQIATLSLTASPDVSALHSSPSWSEAEIFPDAFKHKKRHYWINVHPEKYFKIIKTPWLSGVQGCVNSI